MQIKSSLKRLIDARVSQIKFIDRTFNANKKFAKEIMEFLMENDNNYTTYHFEVTAHLLNDDMLDFLASCKEGLFQFEIGVQTTNEKVLEEVGRRDDFKKLSYVVQKIASYRNIHQHLDLIAGLPYEDYASFEKSFNDVFNLGIEHLQLGFLKMIKGTGVRNRANKHGYRYKDYPPYEILYNDYMSYSQILKLKDIEEILERYYNSKNFILSMKYIIFNYYSESPFKFFEDFATYFDDNGYFDMAQGKNQLYKILLDFYNEKINNNNYFDDNGYFDMAQGKNQLYKILLDFYNEKINNNNDLFNDVLKYDYISLGKTSNLPQFFNKLELEDFKNRCHVFLQDENNIVNLFNDVLKYDYISLGKTSNLPQFFNKLELEDFKNRCHVFLQDENNIVKYSPSFENKPAKHIIKYVHFEPFNYDILKLKKDIKSYVDRKDNVILFIYDDKKVFEKSKAYSIEL